MEHNDPPHDAESETAQQLARLTRYLQYGGEADGSETGGGGLLSGSPGGGHAGGGSSQAVALSSQQNLMDFISADEFASLVQAQAAAEQHASGSQSQSQPSHLLGNHGGLARAQQPPHRHGGALSPTLSLTLAQQQQQQQQAEASIPNR